MDKRKCEVGTANGEVFRLILGLSPIKLLYFFLVLLGTSCAFLPSANLKHLEKLRPTKSEAEKAGINISYWGTSTLFIDDGKTQILIDGFFSRPSFAKVAFGRIAPDSQLIAKQLQKLHTDRLQAVLTCHAHYDHAMDAPLIAKLTGAKLYGNASTLQIAKGAALNESQTTEILPHQPYAIGDFTLTCIPALHTPPVQILWKTHEVEADEKINAPLSPPAKVEEYKEGGCYDFYLQHKSGKRILIKASTNFIPHALDAYPCDVLFLGIASLGKRDSLFQQNYYKETVLATGAQRIIPIHWDNFMKPLNHKTQALARAVDRVEKGIFWLETECKKDNRTMEVLFIGDGVGL